MESWEGKVAVVTGASRGIGLAVTTKFLEQGMFVVGLARTNIQDITQLPHKENFYYVQCDTSDEKSVLMAFESIVEKHKVVHILVNNAGTVRIGKIEEVGREVWEEIFNLNVLGLLQCTRQALKLMRKAGVHGHIINLNSISGHKTVVVDEMPLNVYSASKFAVTAITDQFIHEAKNDKIKFTSVSPGYVKTTIFSKNNQGEEIDTADWPGLEPRDVADAIFSVINTPPHVQITELTIVRTGEKYLIGSGSKY